MDGHTWCGHVIYGHVVCGHFTQLFTRGSVNGNKHVARTAREPVRGTSVAVTQSPISVTKFRFQIHTCVLTSFSNRTACSSLHQVHSLCTCWTFVRVATLCSMRWTSGPLTLGAASWSLLHLLLVCRVPYNTQGNVRESSQFKAILVFLVDFLMSDVAHFCGQPS